MFDIEENPESESIYECLKCGNVVRSDSHPGTCSVCGSDGFQNRAMALE
jgi:rubrerythrin